MPRGKGESRVPATPQDSGALSVVESVLGDDSRRLDTRCTLVDKFLVRVPHRNLFQLTVARLARLFSLHPNTLARDYQRKRKQTLHQSLLTSKLDRLRKVIDLNPGRSIADLAQYAGYESSKHLSAHFKKRFGLTLRAYRRKIRMQRSSPGLSEPPCPLREEEGALQP